MQLLQVENCQLQAQSRCEVYYKGLVVGPGINSKDILNWAVEGDDKMLCDA
jgi:hypothetical protein